MYIPLSVFGLLFSILVISDISFFFNQRRTEMEKSQLERNPIAVLCYSSISIISMIIMIFYIYLTYKSIGWWVILVFFIILFFSWVPRLISFNITRSPGAVFILTNIYIVIEFSFLVYFIIK